MMKKSFTIILFLITAIGTWAAGTPETSVAQAAVEPSTVTITDYLGRNVVVKLPITTLVSMNSGLSEVVAALGAADRVVGRCSYSTFPSSMRRVPVVGKNSSSPNMETLMTMEPDLVIADSMFDEGKIKILENRGISVIIESTSNPEHLPMLVRNLGRVLQEEERAEEILELVNTALTEVTASVEALEIPENIRTVVFFENRKPYKSASALSGHDFFIRSAGGNNIASDEPVKYPALSPEYITMSNPEVIIRRVSGDIDMKAMEAMLLTIIDRPSLKSVDAVRDERVYIVKSDLFISLRYPAGIAYFADLFYPDQLNMDPDDICKSLISSLYGVEEWEKIRETYVYPSR